MADAIPTSKKVKTVIAVPEITPAEGMDPAAFQAMVESIAAAEVPNVITDKQVNEVGQKDNYGKIKSADVIPYNILTAEGDIKRTGHIIRVNH